MHLASNLAQIIFQCPYRADLPVLKSLVADADQDKQTFVPFSQVRSSVAHSADSILVRALVGGITAPCGDNEI